MDIAFAIQALHFKKG